MENLPNIPTELQAINDRYKIQKLIGEGTYGNVYKGKDRKTGQRVAIKLIKNVFRDELHAKYVCRELKLMRHLTSLNNNIYTVKLLDVIVPPSRKYSKNDQQLPEGDGPNGTSKDEEDYVIIVQEYYG